MYTSISKRTTRRAGAAVASVLGASLLLTACPVDVPATPGTTTSTTTTSTTTTSTTTSTTTTAVPPLDAPTISGTACRGTSGVTVVVDFTRLDNTVALGCAPGAQANGLTALAAAGFIATEPSAEGGPATSAVRTVDGLPTEPYPYGWLSGGYWGYYQANRPGTWSFSPVGAGNGPLVEGTVEGWAWQPDFDGAAPRISVAELDGHLPPLPACKVPDAPALTRISNLETLPFTIDGGGPIEVTTLAPGDPLGDATWTTASSLDLAPFSGATRVVARSAATDCTPTIVFDATYDVRPLYSGESGTADSSAVASTDPVIVGWATGYTDYVAGADVTASFQTPNNAVGAYGSDIVVLGNAGRVTMTFLDHPISNGDGDDFAVFENGFVSAGNLFCELAYVEVSSDGVNFVRFDSASRQPTAVGAFGSLPWNLVGGLAGKDTGGYGTPFDLTVLANKVAVRNGTVNLGAITHVRIVDIVGADDYPTVGDRYHDSFGRQIFDAHKTTGSGGFDLRGVGVLHQS